MIVSLVQVERFIILLTIWGCRKCRSKAVLQYIYIMGVKTVLFFLLCKLITSDFSTTVPYYKFYVPIPQSIKYVSLEGYGRSNFAKNWQTHFRNKWKTFVNTEIKQIRNLLWHYLERKLQKLMQKKTATVYDSNWTWDWSIRSSPLLL